MLSDRLYWGALGLFGLTALARGLVGLFGTSPGIAAYAVVLGGLLVVGAAAVGLVRGRRLEGGADSTLVRASAIGGALVYATVTAVDLLL